MVKIAGALAVLVFGTSCSHVSPLTSLEDDRAPASLKNASSTIPLSQGWFIQNSDSVSQEHAKLSLPGVSLDGWISTSVPSTVLGAIVDSRGAGQPDPFLGMNLLNLPGSGPYYVVGKSYSELETSKDSPFGKAWWYRTEFSVPEELAQKTVELHFDGINYSAEIWLNGHLLANSDEVAGTFRNYSFNVTPDLKSGSTNTLAVLVSPPQLEDLSSSSVDWNPTPQDKNMGIWKPVYLSAHDVVSLEHSQVLTKLDLPDLKTAHLSVETMLTNHSNAAVTGELRGKIEDINFSKSMTLSPGETQDVLLTPEEFPQLNVANPKLWWPAQMGEPHLYTMKLGFVQGSAVSDYQKLTFGIRQVNSKITSQGSRLFFINGKKIQIRGGGWATDFFLKYSQDRVQKELQYVLDMGLNTVRVEGDFQPDEFYDLTDRYGILVMPGFVCCSAWQESKKWSEDKFPIAAASARDLILELRSHPSVFTFLYGSDEAPSAKAEKMYVDTFNRYNFPDPIVASAANTNTPLNGKSGFKMNGPYNYTPPSYWYLEKGSIGGAWGFNTETSPGQSIPPIESLRQFIPADHLWPIDEVWNFHAGVEDFTTINSFTKALDLRYGPSKGVEEFAMKSQVMAYDNHRAMFEAFGKNKYHSATGLIQWMLNNSWPSLNWHLYDYYLRQGGTYFGVKKANEPVHIQYSYDDQTIFLVNGTYQDVSGLVATVEVFDAKLNPLLSKKLNAAVSADSSANIFSLGTLKIPSKLYFLKLTLDDSEGHRVSNNFYWLSTQAEAYDWGKTNYIGTPVLQEADMTELNSLKDAHLSIKTSIHLDGHAGSVKIKNTSDQLAFFTHLKLVQKETEILPILWQDNYISLTPGEERTIEFQATNQIDLHASATQIEVEGWNVKRTNVGVR